MARFKYDGSSYGTNEIMEWVNKKFNFQVHEVSTVKDLEKYFHRSGSIVLYYGEKDHPRFKLFMESAHDNLDVPYLQTDSPNIQWKYKLKRNNFAILHKDTGEMQIYDGLWKRDRMDFFVYQRTKPLFLNPKNQTI